MTAMYDTVNFWIDRIHIKGGNPFAIADYLSDVTECYGKDGRYSIKGKIRGYTVYVSESGILLIGSLAEFMFGSNIYTLTRHTTKFALEKLSDFLNLDMKQAKIYRIDIATVLQTEQSPCSYYRCLGYKTNFTRLETSKTTLEYRNGRSGQNQRNKLTFYDKTKQMKDKGKEVPKIFENSNLLRYELKLNKNLKQQLNISEINGKLLTSESFYHSLIQRWKNEYETIKKINTYQINSSVITSPKMAQDGLFAILLQQQGQSGIDEYISTLKAQNTFSDPKYYTRTYKSLNKLISAEGIEEGELVRELNSLIFEVAKNAE